MVRDELIDQAASAAQEMARKLEEANRLRQARKDNERMKRDAEQARLLQQAMNVQMPPLAAP